MTVSRATSDTQRLAASSSESVTQGLLEPLAETLLGVMPTMNVALHMTHWM